MRKIVVTFLLLLTSLETLSTQSSFTIGHIDHPKVAAIYKDLIYKSYQDIGIEVKFTQVGTEQGLKLLSEGLTDADVVRYKAVTLIHKNIILVEPPLVSTNITLYCFQSEICNESILSDQNNIIATTIVSLKSSENRMPEIALKAQVMVFDNHTKIAQLIRNGRIKYGILPTGNNALPSFTDVKFTHFNLGQYQAYHVINKKHQHLQPALSKAIELRLKALAEKE